MVNSMNRVVAVFFKKESQIFYRTRIGDNTPVEGVCRSEFNSRVNGLTACYSEVQPTGWLVNRNAFPIEVKRI